LPPFFQLPAPGRDLNRRDRHWQEKPWKITVYPIPGANAKINGMRGTGSSGKGSVETLDFQSGQVYFKKKPFMEMTSAVQKSGGFSKENSNE
jgi:hypothetical protein